MFTSTGNTCIYACQVTDYLEGDAGREPESNMLAMVSMPTRWEAKELSCNRNPSMVSRQAKIIPYVCTSAMVR